MCCILKLFKKYCFNAFLIFVLLLIYVLNNFTFHFQVSDLIFFHNQKFYVQIAVAKEHKNPIEELNAMETLGRIHLLQGQSPSNEEARTSLIAAQEAFMKSLDLCKMLVFTCLL